MKFLFIIMFSFIIQEVIFSQGDTLTVEQCVNIALQNNPQLRAAQSLFDLNAANVVSTRSSLFPQIFFQSSYSQNGGTTFLGPTARPGNYNNYAFGFQGSLLVFDFGKTYSRISSSADLRNASEQDVISARENLILNTYQAYFTYLQAIRLFQVSNEVMTQAEEHLKQAQALVDIGRRPEFDILKAKSDLENARVNLLNAENNISISKIQLFNIMNTKDTTFAFKDVLEVKKDSIDEKTALETALQKRPEIIASRFRVESNKSLVTAAWMSNLPSISATGGYNWRTYSLNQAFLNSWNIGVNFAIPIFQGFAIDASVQEAKANLNYSESQNDLTVQSVTLDVQQQVYNLHLAQAKITAGTSLRDQAKETLRLAQARYNEEVGSAVEVTDATVAYYNAEIVYIQSLYDYQVANVRLQRAMGTLK